MAKKRHHHRASGQSSASNPYQQTTTASPGQAQAPPQPGQQRVQIDPADMINEAKEEGIGLIIKRYPKFEGYESMLEKYINPGDLQTKLQLLVDYANTHTASLGIHSTNDFVKYVLDGMTDYIAKGGGMDKKAKEILLKKGLEAKAAKPFGFLSQWRLHGEDYLGKAIQLASKLEGYASAGGNLGQMPTELLDTAQNLKKLGWSDVVLDEMTALGHYTKGEYYALKRQIVRRAEEEVGRAKGYLEKSVSIILGIVGLGILAVNAGITGAIIGTSAKITGSIAGVLLIALSCVLLSLSLKKK